MRATRVIQLQLIVLAVAVGNVVAKPWRGITPLQSTRSEVERLLGNKGDQKHDWVTYQTDNAAVSVLYSRGLPCQPDSNNEWRVTEGIVISITVAPKTLILLSQLNVDTNKYQKKQDPHHLNGIEYYDPEEGESIAVVNGEISSFRYFGGSSHSHLRCDSAPN